MPTQFKYGLVTKNVKWLLAFEMCANDRFEMEGPRRGTSETKGCIGCIIKLGRFPK